MSVLMFHDVVGDKCQTSGFQTIGARQYELSEAVFNSIVRKVIEIEPDVVLTFDDGGVSFLEVIAPILEKYGKKGIFFITTSKIGTPNFLTGDQIRELHARGHIIASHSHTHPRDISKLDYSEILTEWKKSKEMLEYIVGSEINVASIPGGAVSDNVLKAMVEAGYTSLYTSEPTDKVKSKNGIEVLGRFSVTSKSTPGQIANIISDPKEKAKLIVRYKLLRLAKTLMGSNYNKIKQVILKIKR